MAPPPLPRIMPRASDSHKGTYGHVLAVGGCRGMVGAIALCGQAALRAGSGLVTMSCPDRCSDLAASFHPCCMTYPLPGNDQGEFEVGAGQKLLSFPRRIDAWAIGPGMGRSHGSAEILMKLLSTRKSPMVVDADGLHLLSYDTSLLSRSQPNPQDSTEQPLILTPHPGEFERLTGSSAKDRSSQVKAAVELARSTGAIILLKGFKTVITDGEQLIENPTGGPWMAVGGSGDCLTGIIASLLGQGYSPWDAASLGAYWHGLAADLAVKDLGGPSVLATDIIQWMPKAYRTIIEDSLPE